MTEPDVQREASGSFVEAKTTGTGQVIYVIRVVPGATTIEELRDAIDLAQQALLYARGDDDEESEDE